MRTKERWIKYILPKRLYEFPPRIQEVLKEISTDWDSIPFSGNSAWVFISGKVDTGKTILAVQIALKMEMKAYLNSEVKKTKFVSISRFLQTLKDSFNSNEKNDQEVINYLCDCDILILDDFGCEKPTDWVLQVMYMIINHRYDYLKPTIITSNLKLEELAKLFGDDRITSRIKRSSTVISKTKYK
jgi:DNA replication protein DnaC